MVTGHGMAMITVRLVLKTLTNGNRAFTADEDAEIIEYNQTQEARRAGDFHLDRGVMVCKAMHSKD